MSFTSTFNAMLAHETGTPASLLLRCFENRLLVLGVGRGSLSSFDCPVGEGGSAGCAQVLLLLDADFIASAGLHEFLTKDDKAANLMEDLTVNRKVIVLPAFETEASLGVDGGGEMALKAQASASSFYFYMHAHDRFHTVVATCRQTLLDAYCGRWRDGAPGPSQYRLPPFLYLCTDLEHLLRRMPACRTCSVM